MATNKDSLLRDMANFSELSVPEQREILLRFQAIHEDALVKRRKQLLEELNALGSPAGKASNGRSGSPQIARYRSKKDPLLVWSGRGRVARWLVEEMKQTGLAREAFKVK
jgi:DNA-binding protein H-NS